MVCRQHEVRVQCNSADFSFHSLSTALLPWCPDSEGQNNGPSENEKGSHRLERSPKSCRLLHLCCKELILFECPPKWPQSRPLLQDHPDPGSVPPGLPTLQMSDHLCKECGPASSNLGGTEMTQPSHARFCLLPLELRSVPIPSPIVGQTHCLRPSVSVLTPLQFYMKLPRFFVPVTSMTFMLSGKVRITPCGVSCCSVSCRGVSCRVASRHVVALLCRVVPCGVVWCRALWCGMVSCVVVWYGVVSCAVSCRVVSCRVVSCRDVWCHVVSCRVVSCGVVSYHVPCRVSCRVGCHGGLGSNSAQPLSQEWSRCC